MPICPVAAPNGIDAVPKLRALRALHADGHLDGYRAYHSGKHTAPTRPAPAAT